MLAGWLLFRVRKVVSAGLVDQVPLALFAAVGIDIARMTGFALEKLRRLRRRYMPPSRAELEHIIELWQDHGSLESEDCDVCRALEFYRVTGTWVEP